MIGYPEDILNLCLDISDLVSSGKGVVVHCKIGIGRTALVAVCILLCHGYTYEQAVRVVSKARGRRVPATEEQARWLTEHETL